jgi:hypothetical protein
MVKEALLHTCVDNGSKGTAVVAGKKETSACGKK